MGKVSIVTDSLADIPAGLVEKYNIHVIPILVMFGQETFRDGVDITPEEFYRRFRESAELPTTAVPSMIEFVKLYQKLGQEADGIVSIHISEHLSATVETAKVASKELPEIPIRVIDTPAAQPWLRGSSRWRRLRSPRRGETWRKWPPGRRR